jgi:hypothetical protein
MMKLSDSFQTYLFSYEHAGASWVLELKASSAQDAQARLRKLHAATFDGEMVTKVTVPTITVSSVARWLRRLILGR